MNLHVTSRVNEGCQYMKAQLSFHSMLHESVHAEHVNGLKPYSNLVIGVSSALVLAVFCMVDIAWYTIQV